MLAKNFMLVVVCCDIPRICGSREILCSLRNSALGKNVELLALVLNLVLDIENMLTRKVGIICGIQYLPRS